MVVECRQAFGSIGAWVRSPRAWALRSTLFNALGSGLDYAILPTACLVFGLPTPYGAMLGVACGATFSFTMNRWLVFSSPRGSLVGQALRYAVAMAALMSVHAWVAWALRDRLGVPLLAAKVLADVGVLAVSQPLVLRLLVFQRTRAVVTQEA
jgi:putative flippase GtrA